MTTDRDGDRTPAQSRAVARAIGYLERGEAGRELAVAALIRGGYPTERAAGMVEGVLEGCFKRRDRGTPAPVDAGHSPEDAAMIVGTMPA